MKGNIAYSTKDLPSPSKSQFQFNPTQMNESITNTLQQEAQSAQNESLGLYRSGSYSILPLLGCIWGFDSGVEMYIKPRDLIVLTIILIFVSYIILEDCTATRDHIFMGPGSKRSRFDILRDPPYASIPKQSSNLMLHRFRNSRFRHKKFLHNNYYLLYHNKVGYSKLELEVTLDLDKPLNEPPYLSMICMVIGVTYLIKRP